MIVKKKSLTPIGRRCILSLVMEDLVYQTLLFDFYGELLTKHQKEVYEDYLCNDISESEIAKDSGISRQAAHDMIRRSKKALLEYEEKLHLAERFINIREKIVLIRDNTEDEAIKKIVDEIIEDL